MSLAATRSLGMPSKAPGTATRAPCRMLPRSQLPAAQAHGGAQPAMDGTELSALQDWSSGFPKGQADTAGAAGP